eukprot:INCI16068.1.p1 GENE.INCI16068.1~~INCI16068.1.p1  ORF type:complete len:1029 (-),score=150.17 INCI16068.1:45-3131(-)
MALVVHGSPGTQRRNTPYHHSYPYHESGLKEASGAAWANAADAEGYVWGYFWEYWSVYLEFDPEFYPWALHLERGELVRWYVDSDGIFLDDAAAGHTYPLGGVQTVSCESPDPDQLFFILLEGQRGHAGHQEAGGGEADVERYDLTLQAASEQEWWQWGLRLGHAFALLECRDCRDARASAAREFFLRVFEGDVKGAQVIARSLDGGIDTCLMQRDRFKNTPLLIAASLGDASMVRWMTSSSRNAAHALAMNDMKQTPLLAAAVGGHLECLKAMLYALKLQSIKSGHKSRAKRKSSKHRGHRSGHGGGGARSNADSFASQCQRCVAAAMFGAARHNEPNALEILITEGDGDVFSINAEGQTLAHAAMQEGDNPEVLDLLNSCAPELFELADDYGNTALHFAAHRGWVRSTKFLLEAFVNPHAVNGWGRTAIAVAVVERQSECVEAIYHYGDDGRDAEPAYPARRVFEERTVQFTTKIDKKTLALAGGGSASKQSKMDMERVMRVWDQFFRNAMFGFSPPPPDDDDFYAPQYWSDDGRTRYIEPRTDGLPKPQRWGGDAQGQEVAESDALENWIETVDDEGEVYYENTRTGSFQWAVPGRSEWEVQRTFDRRYHYYFNVLTGRCLWRLSEWEERSHNGEVYYHNVVTGTTQWHAPPEWYENVADDYVWGTEHEGVGQQGDTWEYTGNENDALVPYNDSTQATCDPLYDERDSLSTLEASLDMGQYSPRPNATALATSSASPETHIWVLCDDNSDFEYFWNSTSSESSWEAPEIGWLQRTDTDGNTYFQNLQTYETSWEPPEPVSDRIGSQWERPQTGWLAVVDDVSHAEYFENLATGESSWVLPSSESAVVWDPCLAEDGLTWFYVPRAGNGWAFNFSEGYADWTSVSSTSASVSTDQLGGARGAKLLQDASVTHRLRDDGDGNLWLQSAYTVIRKSSSVQNKTSAGGGAAALKSRKRLTDQARNSAHSNEHVNTSSFQVVAYDARVRAGKAASYAGSNTVEVGHTQWEFPNTGWMLHLVAAAYWCLCR